MPKQLTIITKRTQTLCLHVRYPGSASAHAPMTPGVGSRHVRRFKF